MERYGFTSSEVSEAETWVRLRLAAIGSYSAHLDERIRVAVEEICMVVYRHMGRWVSPSSFSFGMDGIMYGEILEILERLRGEISEMLDTLAYFEDGERTRAEEMEERLDTYIGRWEDETEALVCCGLLSGASSADMLYGMVTAAESDPWGSDLFKEGKEEAMRKGTSNSIILAGGVSYGVGHSNIGHNMLTMLGAGYLTAVYGDMQLADHRDATVFISVTADSKACDECVDEERRGWQPIANYRGAWHPNCRCRFIFR